MISMYCEDYPCCGHTPQDPCERQDYDKPGFFDNPLNRLASYEPGSLDYYDALKDLMDYE
jgi:hypothetical protein